MSHKNHGIFLKRCNNLSLSENIDCPNYLLINKDFTLLSTMKIRKLFQKTIYLADPNVFIRKTNINFIHAMAASTLELRGLNLLEISSMNWKSTSIYVKFYSQPTLNMY